MRKIYLHIGSEKTGSTSIQKSLRQNRSWLLRQNLIYPIINDKYLSLLSLPFGNKYNHYDGLGIKAPEQVSKKLFNELQREFSNNNSNYILSSEFFHSRLRSKENLILLRNFLSIYFDEIVVICYLRNPWEKAVSLLSESIKVGSSPLTFESMLNEYFFHSCSISRVPFMWNAVFPTCNFFFIEDFLQSQSLMDHFYDTISIKRSNLQKVHFMNASLSISEAKILSFFYYLWPSKTAPSASFLSRVSLSLRRKIFHYIYRLQCIFGKNNGKVRNSLKHFFNTNQKEEWLSAHRQFDHDFK